MKNAHTQDREHHDDDHGHYLIPFFIILVFAMIEVVGGWYTGSLALLSDAGHMLSDVAALGLAWMASTLSKKTNIARHASGVTYVELGVSVFNAVSLLVVIVWVVIEALARFKAPHRVEGLGLIAIATLGLLANILVARQLHHQATHHAQSLNNRAAFLHVVGDLLGSVAAVAAGLVIYFTGWMPIDPILSLLISGVLFVFTLNLIRDIWKTLHLKAGELLPSIHQQLH